MTKTLIKMNRMMIQKRRRTIMRKVMGGAMCPHPKPQNAQPHPLVMMGGSIWAQ